MTHQAQAPRKCPVSRKHRVLLMLLFALQYPSVTRSSHTPSGNTPPCHTAVKALSEASLFPARTFIQSGARSALADMAEAPFNSVFGAKTLILNLASLIPSTELRNKAVGEIESIDWKPGDGSNSAKQIAPRDRIWNGLTIVVSHWNQDAENRDNTISLGSLVSPQTIVSELAKMNYIPAAAIVFQKSGALQLLKDTSEEGFIYDFGAKKSVLAIASLIPSEENRVKAIEKINSLDWKHSDGNNTGGWLGNPLVRIWKSLTIIISHWNLDPQNSNRQISLQAILRPEGFQDALLTMRHPPSLALEFQRSNAINTLYRLSTAHLNRNHGAKITLTEIANKIPSDAPRNQALTELQKINFKKTDGHNAKNTGRAPLFRIWAALSMIVGFWNEDAQNQNQQIPLALLLTPDGMRSALETMKVLKPVSKSD